MQLRSVSGMNIPQGHRPVPITIGWSLTLTPFDQQPSLISTLRTAVPRYHMHSPPRDATIERSPLPCVQLKLLIKTLKFEHRRWYIYIPLLRCGSILDVGPLAPAPVPVVRVSRTASGGLTWWTSVANTFGKLYCTPTRKYVKTP